MSAWAWEAARYAASLAALAAFLLVGRRLSRPRWPEDPSPGHVSPGTAARYR